MRHPELAVDVSDDEVKWNEQYHLTQSPSIRERDLQGDPASPTISYRDLDITTPAPPEYRPPKPSILLLYTFCTRHDALFLLLPAIAASVLAGGIAPFMTQVVGQAFDAFSRFPSSNPSQQDKQDLLRGVGSVSLELLALAAGHLALGSLVSCLWIWTGERNVMRLRKRVYDTVTARSMTWLDLKLGGDTEDVVGAGGLLAKFTRETDDVRNASSLAAGMTIQYLVTLIVCLVLAFVRSWSLTLVIFSTVPLLAFVQSIAQRYGFPLYEKEKAGTAKAGTLLERAMSNISIVKAFNATPREIAAFHRVATDVQNHASKSSVIWGISMGFVQFQSMALFVVAFGFGSKLVRDGKVSPGDIMAVFWACLIAASSIQATLPLLETLMKGKISMATLVTFIEEPTPSPTSEVPVLSARSPNKAFSIKSLPIPKPLNGIRGIRPAKCSGEFTLRNVTFAYPARPEQPVLRDVSMYIPAHETTFIVGGSGSGKSTIAQLLLRMYEPQTGSIELDNQSFAHIDYSWAQRHVAAVSQDCMLFDMSVHDNVAMGVIGGGDGAKLHELATRDQVVSACRAALMHDFVRELPQGYNTRLGNGGANLSGGQRQRLAIARAWMRDPTVLILDEATSALDPMSRLLVFEAIKAWRKNKTTIVITHDLSQITSSDFVYLLKGGRVVEQGYRMDLETAGGEFNAIANTQGINGFPEKLVPLQAAEAQLDILLQQTEEEFSSRSGWASARQSLGGVTLRPLTGTWTFDIADLTRVSMKPRAKQESGVLSSRHSKRSSSTPARLTLLRRHSSVVSPTLPSVPLTCATRHASLQPPPVSPVHEGREPETDIEVSESMIAEDDFDFELDKSAMQRSGIQANNRRVAGSRIQRSEHSMTLDSVQIGHKSVAEDSREVLDKRPLAVFRVFRDVCRAIPNKKLIFLGLIACLISGAMTPIFSFMLSRLFFEVSAGGKAVGTITQFALITLALAAADGFFAGLKSILMQVAAVRWITSARKAAFSRVIAQDKAWFDNPFNSPTRLVQVLIKDADDARNLLATCLGVFVVVVAMLGVGLIWALIWGWQLTLAGIAIFPVFVGTMYVQSRLTARFQLRNKHAREEVSKAYFEAISNIRGIRAMAFQNMFTSQFDAALVKAFQSGVNGAFIEGCSFGVTNAMIYLAEALLFYTGAVLVANGTYNYLRMVQVLNLLVFSVSIAAQMIIYIDKVTQSAQAARDMHQVLYLNTDTQEGQGDQCPIIRGRVAFQNVTFAYPQRPDVPVLKEVTLDFSEGECVAIVGSSGSGKSTIAALLQRLYEPNSGSISVGKTPISQTEVSWLREHISVVSQNAHLFDATIHENIAYGASEFPFAQVRRAAKAANVHNFIMSLPRDYNTSVGENASLISGGQAQRLQIARALVRPANILVLDECTSALDAANQAVVMETIQRVKVGRTTIMITHKLPLMRMCDRIVVMQEGAVAEQGSYESLMNRRGVFFKLANAGEWSKDNNQ